jgi:hypothetical protein
MKKAFLFLLFIASVAPVFAQFYPEDFIIPAADQKVPNSLYNNIFFLDSRPAGGMLRKPKRVTSLPFIYQVRNLLKSLTDSTAKDGELLLQLQLFNFSEITSAQTNEGPCYLKAVLYSKKDDRYQKINSIDTVVAIQKEPNLTKETLAAGGKIITTFITNSLLLTPIDTTFYSSEDVENILNTEEQKIPLYHTVKYADGLYFSYGSFMKQTPDKQITATINDTGKISSVRIIENGKKAKISPKEVYAAVYKGIPYIATKYGYYELMKIDGRFVFTGDIDAKDPRDPLMGSLLEEESFEMTLDPANGKFIRLKMIYPNSN